LASIGATGGITGKRNVPIVADHPRSVRIGGRTTNTIVQ
jgi:hypothetical protein